MAELRSIYKAHTGKTSDRWESYFPVYDRIFATYRDKNLSLLEIGIQNGGSLEIWAKYFANAFKIIGCDINPLCGNLRYRDDRISVLIGDINSTSMLKKIASLSQALEIIIDDGSHFSDDIIRTFLLYFPVLSPGGTYVVEDTHCMYSDKHQGGILKQTTAHHFFRLFVDLINCEHWIKDLTIENLFNTFFSRTQTPLFLKEGWIDSIEFCNSMVIIRKSSVPSNSKLGKRVIVGDDASINPEILNLR